MTATQEYKCLVTDTQKYKDLVTDTQKYKDLGTDTQKYKDLGTKEEFVIRSKKGQERIRKDKRDRKGLERY